jgi:hypothetical protein
VDIKSLSEWGNKAMSMLDVAKYLSYSKSVDLSSGEDRYLNLTEANSGRLFSKLYGNRTLWNFGREKNEKKKQFPTPGKGI